jgi:RNA polymerase sigma-70 factor (ECF subfamily)
MATAQELDASLAEASRSFDQQHIYEGLMRGDDTAWNELYNYVNPKLLSYFSNKGFGDSDCEDLSHETFARVFTKLSSYEPSQKPLLHWIYGIAKNVWLQRRRTDKQGKYGQKVNLEEYEEVADNHQSLDVQDESGRSLRQVLQIALAELSDDDQRIIELRLGRDKKLTPWLAIASELSISESAAKMRYSRAIERLRKLTATIMGSPNS